jgi:hypothetical protein
MKDMTRWAGSVALWALAVSLTGYVDAEEAGASADHYPLDQTGGIAVPSADLDQYLATLEERATARRFLLSFGNLLFSAGSVQIGDIEKGELVRMAEFQRTHPHTVAQIVCYADDRAD